MDVTRTMVLVIGGGPGGYVCAIRAGQLGLDTILVEEGALGGTCLNVGCIPSKAFIHAASAFHHAREQEKTNAFGLSVKSAALDFPKLIEWKDGIVGRLTGGVGGLLKKAKVRVIKGRAELMDGKTCQVEVDGKQEKIRAEHLVLATGSKSVELPGLPFGGNVISSTEVLSLSEVPQRLAVIGAGYIGLELGIAYAKLGSQVTVIEAEQRILPAWDGELTRPVAKRLEALGVTVMLRVKAQGLGDSGLRVKGANGEEATVEADKVLVAVGRKARLEGFGLEKLDLAMAGRYLRIDERCHTSMRDVWAIGDVTGEPMLAHRAMAQGEMVAEIIAGHRRAFDKVSIPAICFTDPEIVAAGMLPEQARAAGHEVKVAQFPFVANGRAMTQGDEAGFVRVVARADNHLVLGLQAVGWEVSEFASAFNLALEMGARLEDITGTIHAHPTRGEAIQEAALGALGHALHV